MNRRSAFIVALAISLVVVLVAAPIALAAGNDIGQNIGSFLRRNAGQIYGGIVAFVGLMFLLNRRYTDLATYFLGAVLVGFLVFGSDQVADAARVIARQILP